MFKSASIGQSILSWMLNHNRNASRCQRVCYSENKVFSRGESPQPHFFEGFKEINVPVLNLEVDCMDTRNFAGCQLRTCIEAFVDMLESPSRPVF